MPTTTATKQRIRRALRKYRKTHSLTYRQLADKIGGGCDGITAQRYCEGERLPRTDRLSAIATLVGLSLDELVNGRNR